MQYIIKYQQNDKIQAIHNEISTRRYNYAIHNQIQTKRYNQCNSHKHINETIKSMQCTIKYQQNDKTNAIHSQTPTTQ